MVNPLATLRQTKLRIDKVENASVPPNTERTLCNHTGPGVVVSLWMALGGGAAPALDGRLRVYYDGSPTPAMSYRGVTKNNAWLHTRATALNLRTLIRRGLTRSGVTWALATT